MERAYKFKIEPTESQINQIEQTFGCARFVYNHYLKERQKRYQEGGKTFGYNACSADMTQLKKELVWLRVVDSTALQSSLKNLDIAYANFFSGRARYPGFKKKHTSRQSYTAKNNGKNIAVDSEMSYVKLPKLGFVKVRLSRAVEGRILSATVSKNPAGKYFVSLLCTDVEIAHLPKTGAVVGLDLGIKTMLATSDGQDIPNHKFSRHAEKKMRRLQRSLSRKTKGSNNRNKARIKVARLHEKIANQRKDFQHKLSLELVRNYDIIAIETLKVKNMLKNRKLSRAISDVSWSSIVTILEYKAVWYGKTLVKVDTFYASSQLCSACGHKNLDIKNLNVRQWICPSCGANHDRDKNAAINILDEGLRILDTAA